MTTVSPHDPPSTPPTGAAMVPAVRTDSTPTGTADAVPGTDADQGATARPVAAPVAAPVNGAARAAGVLATTAVAGLGCIVAFGLLNLAFFATVAAVSGLGAIVLGHVGRARGRRTGAGRGTSLAAIVVGWLAIAAVAVIVLLWFTLMAGLHALTS